MNRKKFLKQTASGLIAASFLPLLSFTSNNRQEISKYISKKEYNINGMNWIFTFDINDILFKDFNNAKNEEKAIKINCKDDNNATLDFIYDAVSVKEKTIDDKLLHFINFKIRNGEMDKEEIKFATKNFGKSFTMEIHDKCHAVLNGDKTREEISFMFMFANDVEKDYECFLTTACVFHKGFSDNCYELTTLRSLRKNIMNPNIHYKELISEYEIIAPKMLQNINNATNKEVILDHIYDHLVLPSVSLIEAGKNEDAILHYTNYVKEMKKLYL